MIVLLAPKWLIFNRKPENTGWTDSRPCENLTLGKPNQRQGRFWMLEFLSRRSKNIAVQEGLIQDNEIVIDESELGDIDTEELDFASETEETVSESELEDLMGAIKQQSIDISCEFAAFSNWSAQIETLSARAATLQPMLKGLAAKCKAQAAELSDVARQRNLAERRIGELKSEVEHYRPLAARFEDELHIAREKHSQAQNLLTSLETQFGQAQAYSNELIHKLTAAESKALRVTEENIAIKQKAMEHNTSIQSLMREVAALKSAIALSQNEIERQDLEIATLTEKVSVEKETASQAVANLNVTQMREARMEKDLKMRLAELEDQQQELIQKMALRDKQLYEADIKTAAITSKVEFLTQLNQRLREDLRGHIDHSNMMEVSNRQLLEAMAHRRLEDDDTDEIGQKTGKAKPKLRAVQVAE
jgi:chromosome segregation ATPase